MRTDTTKIKINEKKRNIVVIGDSFDMIDIIEIFLYKKYNVIATIDEFDGMKKIGLFEPICIFIKAATDNLSSVLMFMSKLVNEKNIPVIAFTKEEISTINEFKLKSSGIREIIKFPINRRDFLEVMQPNIILSKN